MKDVIHTRRDNVQQLDILLCQCLFLPEGYIYTSQIKYKTRI